MISIIYEDKDFLVLNKPAGVLVHGNQKNGELTVAGWLRLNYPEVAKVGDDPLERPGLVHRLDKDTSGVLLVARNQPIFEYFKNLFQNHQIEKTYLALVWGRVQQTRGRIEKDIGIKSGSTKRSVHSQKMAKSAITEFQVIQSLEIAGHFYTLLEVIPRTGRTHQIRVHLAFIGHPVMGDRLYGGKKTVLMGLPRHFLHARSLEFTAPSGQRLKFSADLPEELAKFLPTDVRHLNL